MDAIAQAALMIRAGEYETVLAGGMESMSLSPHLLPHSRTGTKFGALPTLDALERDGLEDAFDQESMGLMTDKKNTGATGALFSRDEQDRFAATSHQRAQAAQDSGIFATEITAVSVNSPKGDIVIDRDEGIRLDTTAESMSKLRPAFRPDGTITAGSSSPLSDGACAVVVMSKAKAQSLGLSWLAEIGEAATVAGPDNALQPQPGAALNSALAKARLTPHDLDVVEVNEAFAVVALQSMADLQISADRVNVNGGALALGHPIGMSGARIVLHAANELGRRGGRNAGAGICGGGGQGQAILLHRGSTS